MKGWYWNIKSNFNPLSIHCLTPPGIYVDLHSVIPRYCLPSPPGNYSLFLDFPSPLVIYPKVKLAYHLVCHTHLYKECPQYHGPKEDSGVTSQTCDEILERAQMVLVQVRAPGVENTSHPRRLGVARVRPRALGSLWHPDSRILRSNL